MVEFTDKNGWYVEAKDLAGEEFWEHLENITLRHHEIFMQDLDYHSFSTHEDLE